MSTDPRTKAHTAELLINLLTYATTRALKPMTNKMSDTEQVEELTSQIELLTSLIQLIAHKLPAHEQKSLEHTLESVLAPPK